VRKIHRGAWGLLLLSAALQVVIFPLPSLYWLSWIAVAPLLVALLRARPADTLQLEGQERQLPATPWQGFLLGYACGILWIVGSFYWIFDTMHHYGGLPVPVALLTLFLFSMYVGLYHGLFGMLLAMIAESRFSGARPAEFGSSIRRALAAAPFLWVAVEIARTRTSPVPWQILGYAQTGNFALTRIATFTGVYGLSFEIVLVNSVFAAAFLAPKNRRKWLLGAALAATVILQSGQWLAPPALAADHAAILVQPDIPIQEGAAWTKEYFQSTLQDLTAVSLRQAGASSGNSGGQKYDLIVWPESPTPFYTNDPLFREAVSSLARQSGTSVMAGSIGINNLTQTNGGSEGIFNSAALVNPQGEWVGRYDKVHLVPFGEYLPFPKLFAFAGGLTKEVGEFQRGVSRAPLEAGGERFGLFICYESIFPDEVRQFALQGAQVLVNISNDGWYGDSGAWKEHLQETRMRAVENGRWLLLATNTGITASIDPYGRIVAATPRNVRAALAAPYGLISSTTFYTRHGDWFAYLCAIISAGALVSRYAFSRREK
jgi:apolipoprotein N-acyltransferase